MKLATIVGARPQFIKAAAVSRPLRVQSSVKEILIHTGQHFDDNMSAVFFAELEIPAPDHNLGIAAGTHGAQTGRMLEAIERVLLAERPDRVLVYGDTNSTLAGALAAAKLAIPVAHVEAGLRTFDRSMPEEVNRLLTDHMSDILFAPTTRAVDNLKREGLEGAGVHLVGDVMLDLARYYSDKSDRSSILSSQGLEPKRYVLATAHRAQNTDSRKLLSAIAAGLRRVAAKLPVVLPLHPRTRKALGDEEMSALAKAVRVIDPIGYLDMLALEKNAALVVTDSGGMQKEAFFFRVPCVTLRSETEWTELVELGWNRLCPPSAGADAIARTALGAIGTVGAAGAPYGDGRAAEAIVATLLKT